VCALLAGGFLIAVIVALGRHTPVYEMLSSVPPLSAVRYPVKAMLAASLCWALLAGAGFDAWASGEAFARRRWWLLVIVPIGLATLGASAIGGALALWPDRLGAMFLVAPEPTIRFRQLLLGTVPSLAFAAFAGAVASIASVLRLVAARRFTPLAVVVAAAAIVPTAVWHDGVSPTAPRDLYTLRPPLVAALSRTDHARMYVYDYNVAGKSRRYLGRDFPYEITHGLPGWPYPATKALVLRLSMFPPVGGVWGLPGSFDHDTPGLAPRLLSEMSDLLLLVEGTAAHLRLLQLGAVANVVALHTEGLQDLKPVLSADALMNEPVRVFEVPDFRPRAYAVSGARIADGDSALRLLLDPQFDPRGEVVLPSGVPAAGDPGFRGEVVLTYLGTDRMALDADLSAPGYVVVVDTFDPGWRARVDGRETAVLRANAAFRAVAVGAGRHSIELRYRPRELVTGLAVSAFSLLALAAAGAAHFARRAEA
jgi:hypothetical protein